MEAPQKIVCSLCSSPISSSSIEFTCGHSLCFECFPFLIYNILQESGIQSDFFQNPKKQHFCQICKKGQAVIPYKELFGHYEKKQDMKPEKQPLCESCKKKLAFFICQECNQNYCEQCATFFHKTNKKISNHTLLGFD